MTRRTQAILFDQPGLIATRPLQLKEREANEALVAIDVSAISTGTERLLYSGDMPAFPGMGYPLVPGYEAIGRVVMAADDGGPAEGTRVFVPGSNGFLDAKGLFGASASDLIVRADRLAPLPDSVGEEAVLIALAATAHHALMRGEQLPDLIVGHGVLGRLAARLSLALGGAPKVWETHAGRMSGARGYEVLSPEADERRDYRSILDLSGDAAILDTLIAHMARGAEIVLAGFYKAPLAFAFPPAFMREATIKIAAEWAPSDMEAVMARLSDDTLDLTGLLTHRAGPGEADKAYRTAFQDADCLKMIIEWGAGA